MIKSKVVLYLVVYLSSFSNSSKLYGTADEFNYSFDQIQYPFPESSGNKERADEVKNLLLQDWTFYKKHAWGWDEINPVNGKGSRSRNNLSATIVDALSTLYVMNLEDEIKEADSYIQTIEWKNAVGLMDPFETTIRYLGGLVSAYDVSQKDLYLDKAIKLAKRLIPAIRLDTGMWMQRVNFKLNKGIQTSPWISVARAGTSWLEFYRLSQQSGSPEYLQKASKTWELLVNPIFNGPLGKALIYSPIDITSGYLGNYEISFGAGGDSYYEYLIKSWIMAPSTETALYRDRWVEAIEVAMTNLSVTTREGHTFLAIWRDYNTIDYTFGHLGCFIGGNVVLGARVLKRDDFMKWGEKLIAGCRHTYASTPTGIGPELFRFVPADRPLPHLHGKKKRQLQKWGFWITDGAYKLRPEVIESYFYGWRITGDPKYREWAWDAFLALKKWTRADYGHTKLLDVTTGRKGRNAQESF